MSVALANLFRKISRTLTTESGLNATACLSGATGIARKLGS